MSSASPARWSSSTRSSVSASTSETRFARKGSIPITSRSRQRLFLALSLWRFTGPQRFPTCVRNREVRPAARQASWGSDSEALPTMWLLRRAGGESRRMWFARWLARGARRRLCGLPHFRRGHSEPFEGQELEPYIDSDYDMLDDNPKAAEAEAAFLQAKTFSEYTVGLLHGRMKSAEKREVMERFRAGGYRCAGQHHRHRSGRGRRKRHGYDRRGCRPLWPCAASSAPRAHRPRREARPGVFGGIVFRR